SRIGLADVLLLGQSPGSHLGKYLGEVSATAVRDTAPPATEISRLWTWRRPRRRRPAHLEFADLEDFGAAVGAHTLDRGATVCQCHRFRILDLDLLALFDAVALGHLGASFHCRSRQARGVREVDWGRL